MAKAPSATREPPPDLDDLSPETDVPAGYDASRIAVLEDTTRTLSRQLTEMEQRLSQFQAKLDDNLEAVNKLVLQMTGDVEAFKASQASLLPREVRQDVPLGALYVAAFQAFMIAYVGSNPTVLGLTPAQRDKNTRAIDMAMQFGDELVNAFKTRLGDPKDRPAAKKT